MKTITKSLVGTVAAGAMAMASATPALAQRDRDHRDTASRKFFEEQARPIDPWYCEPTIFWIVRMSALGQKQTCAAHKPMSAKCQKRTGQDRRPIQNDGLQPDRLRAVSQLVSNANGISALVSEMWSSLTVTSAPVAIIRALHMSAARIVCGQRNRQGRHSILISRFAFHPIRLNASTRSRAKRPNLCPSAKRNDMRSL